jgi:hypothetical protein
MISLWFASWKLPNNHGLLVVMPQSEYRISADGNSRLLSVYLPNQTLTSRVGLYNAEVATHIADYIQFSNPLVISSHIARRASQIYALKNAATFDRLEKAGFLLERDGDIIYCLHERLGGHYMDVGASRKIADGLVGFFSRMVLCGCAGHFC